MLPNPEGPIYDEIPICLLARPSGSPICLLFAVACHSSTVSGFQISADYPGVAMDRLNAHLGIPCSLFLQGAGGDAKPAVIGRDQPRWRVGDWDDVRAAGETVAREVTAALRAGLTPVEPELRSVLLEIRLRLQSPLDRSGYQAIVTAPQYALHRLWA